MKEFKPEERTIVAKAEPADWRDPPTIVIGLSEVAFAAMGDGRTHTIAVDVSGVPVQILIFREPTLALCRAKLQETAATLGVADRDLPSVGIPMKKGH